MERRIAVEVPFIGTAEAARRVRLIALVEGQVERVTSTDGAAVTAGQVLFELGGRRVDIRRRALQESKAAAVRRCAAAESRLQQASRRDALHLAEPGEVAAAEREVAAAAANLAAARADLERFEAALQLRAPRAGRFTDRRVSPGQDVVPGEILGELTELSSIRITAEVLPVPGREPRPGQPAVVLRDGTAPLAASVTALQPETAVSGAVRVWLEGEALSTLQPGTPVRGSIVVEVHEHAVTVPKTAIVRDGQDRPLLYVGHTAPFARREVSTGVEGSDWIEISTGLAPAEEVVVEGAYGLYWAEFTHDFRVED